MTTNIELQNWLKQFPDSLEILVVKEKKDWSGHLVWAGVSGADLGEDIDYIECWPGSTPAILFGATLGGAS